MLLTMMLTAILSGPIVVPQKRCITSCYQVTMYNEEVWDCVYDEQPQCGRFQKECVDEGVVMCRPRVVNLGGWSYMYQSQPKTYY